MSSYIWKTTLLTTLEDDFWDCAFQRALVGVRRCNRQIFFVPRQSCGKFLNVFHNHQYQKLQGSMKHTVVAILTFFLDVENSWIVCRLTLTPAPALCWWPPTVSPAWPRLRSGTRAMAALMLWHSLSIGQALCWLGFVCMEAPATTSMKWSCWWRSVERWVLQGIGRLGDKGGGGGGGLYCLLPGFNWTKRISFKRCIVPVTLLVHKILSLEYG